MKISFAGNRPLHLSSSKNHVKIVKFLLEEGVDIEARNNDSETSLIIAANCGHLSVVKYLVGYDANVNAKDKSDFTPLMRAVKEGQFKVVRYLLSTNKCDISIRNDWCQNVIEIAEEVNEDSEDGKKSSMIVKAILEYVNKSLVNTTCSNTALIIAAKEGKTKRLKTLIPNKKQTIMATRESFDIEAKDKQFGWTALMWASYGGHLEAARYLIENCANVNAKDELNYTSLTLASKKGRKEVVEYLLSTNVCNLEERTTGGWNALIHASHENHLPIVQYLVKKGANIDAIDDKGWTALVHASIKNHLPIVEYLVEKNANIDLGDKYGKNGLHVASMLGNESIVEFLLDHNANPNAFDGQKCTPLYHSSGFGHCKISELLIAKKAVIDSRNSPDDWTPLMTASYEGNLDICKILINNGADIDAKCRSGCTPLFYASVKGHLQIVEFFISKDVNLLSVSDKGHTALTAAQNEGHLRVVSLLKPLV